MPDSSAAKMVTQVTAMSRNGISDWLIQRLSALLLAFYTVSLVIWFLMTPSLSYDQWQALFDTSWVQVCALVGLLAACAHAWIGVWTCGSDYLSDHSLGARAVIFRFVYQTTSILILIVYLLWGINILWGT